MAVFSNVMERDLAMIDTFPKEVFDPAFLNKFKVMRKR